MPEQMFAMNPYALGGKGDFRRTDLRMAIRAIKRFGLSDELRTKMKDAAERVMDTSQDEKTRMLGVKMLIEMDKIDAVREETSLQQRHHEVMEATAVLRAAMQGGDVRDQLAKLSDHVCKPLPIDVQNELDQVQTAEAAEVLHGMNNFPADHKNGNGKP